MIYSTGEARKDNWDAGGWSWKNSRTAEAVRRVSNSRDPNEIVERISPQEQDIVIRKTEAERLLSGQILRTMSICWAATDLVMAGCTTSGCVRATVIDAFSLNIRSIVVEDGCFDRSQVSHAVTLFDLHCKYADVIMSDEVLEHVKVPTGEELFDNLPGRSGPKAFGRGF